MLPKIIKKRRNKKEFGRAREEGEKYKIDTYELIKEYPNHGLYINKESGLRTCFTKTEIYMMIKAKKEKLKQSAKLASDVTDKN